MDKKTKKAIRLRIIQLLDSENPNYSEIQRLSKMLGVEAPVARASRRKEKVVEVEVFVKMRNEGYSHQEIADYYGITKKRLKSEVIMLYRKGDLKGGVTPTGRNPVLKLSREDYLALKEKGMSDMNISKMFGVPHCQISYKRAKWGMIPQKNKVKISKEEFLEMKNSGLTIKEIAARTNLSRNGLYNYRKNWGLV